MATSVVAIDCPRVRFSALRYGLGTALPAGTLEDNALEAGATVELLLDVLGGGEASRYKKSTSKMRWKWKKKRTRRLQRKRRKMRARAK